MKVEKLIEILDADFFTGVPDSQLKALCNYLMHRYGIDPKHHVIAANEGNCTALAAGYHLATGKVPVVYMQNSGEGNIINPTASLLNDKVYGIPVIFIVGWRGEPGIHDEPQHIYQGEITLKLLEDLGIESFVIGKDTEDAAVAAAMAVRADMYNRQMEALDRREAAGESLLLRPPQALGIGHCEKNPDELQRVYDLGAREAEERIGEIRRFLGL